MLHRHTEIVAPEEGDGGKGLVFGDGEAGQSSVVGILISSEDNRCSEVGDERGKGQTD